MNAFDKQYIFRHADLSDTESIMNFIKEEWPKKEHILAKNKEFFLYEFQNENLLNFVVAINQKTGQIDGLMGYIPASNKKETLDIWGCMWLTRRKGSAPFLGLEILYRMKSIVNYRIFSGVGTNPDTAASLARNKAKHHVFKMKHFYRLSDCCEYKIAKIDSKKQIERPDIPQFCLEEISHMKDIEKCIEKACKATLPLKNTWYLEKRFLNHPVYEYCVWAIVKSDEKSGVLIGREIEVNGRKILRIVDFIGEQELLCGLYDAFELLIDVNGYEYIDFYVVGIEDICLINAGFTLKAEDDNNIIPNYFEPFVQTNVDIYGTSEASDVRMCKADADQDRPNWV